MLDSYETWDLCIANKEQERSQDRSDLKMSESPLETSLPL